MRRMKRTTRAHTLTLQPSLPPLNPHTLTPFHTFDFSLVTDACTNSDSHSRTSLSARNAYEGTINYKNSTYTEENKNKNVLKNNHDWQFSCVMIKIAPIFDSFISKFISMCY